MEVYKKNILLIAGTGQNVGKTLFACHIIENSKYKGPIVCIKISPHFHNLNQEMEIIRKTVNYVIAKENREEGKKDSNRLFRAGSKDVYYVQGKDDSLPDIFSYFEKTLSPEIPVICESGGLRNFIVPGLFLMLNKKNNNNNNNNNIKPRAIGYKQLADKWIEFNGEEFNFSAKNIAFTQNGWEIKND